MKSLCVQIAHHCLRIGLGAVFVVAGILKLRDVSRFADHVGDFGVVYDGLVEPAAWSIILLELAVGLGLVINIRGSLAGALLLLGGFTSILLYGIGMGLDIECGCFGPGHRVSLKTQFIVDLGLLCWCGLIYWTRRCCSPQTMGVTSSISKPSSHGESAQ